MSRLNLAWLGGLVLLSVLLMGMSGGGVLSPIEGLAFRVTHPFRLSLALITRPITDLVANLNPSASNDELERLRDENSRLQTEIAQLREIAARYQELQQLLRIRPERPGDEFVEASVRGRDASGLHSAIVINRGRDDGLREGMVVVAPNGALVGTLLRVNAGHSWVRLLDDPSTAISAAVQPSKASGVVSGNFGGALKFSLVPQGAEIKQGDLVVTAGLGGAVPAAIPVGRVSKVSGGRQELFKEIEIEPTAKLDSLTQVLVISNFVPTRMDRP